MPKTINSLYAANVDPQVIKFLEWNRDWWSFDDAVMMARNPLIFVRKDDRNWRPGLTRAIKKSGLIKKHVDSRALSVFYLYVATYLARPYWWSSHFRLDSRLEKELYEQITRDGVSEEDYCQVIAAIRKLPEKEALIILCRYGFINQRIYKSYDGLRKQLPKEHRNVPSYLKTREKSGLQSLRELLPPLFKRITEKEKLLRQALYSRDEEEKARIALKLFQEYGVKTF